jgi:hypothetical protein
MQVVKFKKSESKKEILMFLSQLFDSRKNLTGDWGLGPNKQKSPRSGLASKRLFWRLRYLGPYLQTKKYSKNKKRKTYTKQQK